MEYFKIQGGTKLKGTIKIGGAKNSVVALVPAAILTDEVEIENVPDISDVKALKKTLTYLNVDYKQQKTTLKINTKNMINKPITEQYAKLLRASYYFTGALLGKYKKTEMHFPGGCTIGQRPIDLHLYGFKKLGAQVQEENGKYIICADKLKGADIKLKFASVGATINILLAAVYAEGKTTIQNAAKEPEVENLVDFLNSMGANIKIEKNQITIIGVKKLNKGKIKVIPDRIEAGTYIIAGVMMGDNLKIENIIPKHIESLTHILKQMNADIKIDKDYIIANQTKNLKPINVTTEVYPGFPTDLQQPLTSLLTLAHGTSTITEKIYENRFQNVPYLNKMGANIQIKEQTLYIKGPTQFTPKEVMTTDLRAGAALILAALNAKGETKIKEIKYVLRGYENIIKKLNKVGIKISIENE